MDHGGHVGVRRPLDAICRIRNQGSPPAAPASLIVFINFAALAARADGYGCLATLRKTYVLEAIVAGRILPSRGRGAASSAVQIPSQAKALL